MFRLDFTYLSDLFACFQGMFLKINDFDFCFSIQLIFTSHSANGSLMKTSIVLSNRSEFSRRTFIVSIIIARNRPDVPIGDINSTICRVKRIGRSSGTGRC